MDLIEHIIEPQRLLLVWQVGYGNGARTRRVVAEIVKPTRDADAELRYLTGTDDFEYAKDEGFEGYPAFAMKQTSHTSGVLDSFIRRLPPRKRDDFGDYLTRHRLPTDQSLSDMVLLGYTHAQLPGDGFAIFPDFGTARPPLEVVIEVAGFRYQKAVPSDDIHMGDPVTFKVEPDNVHDQHAIAIFYRGSKIGYVDRARATSFHLWLSKGLALNGTIERINGKPERPLVYIYVAVR